MRITIPAFAGALLMAGCGTQIVSYPAPPPLPAETTPLPPVSEQAQIWRPGDWLYVGGSYRYEPGRYEPRGNHGTLWTRGHWVGDRGNYAWVPGSWS